MTVTVALKNHGVTVADTSTPLDLAGNPLFDAVWAYLCFRCYRDVAMTSARMDLTPS